MHGRISQLVTVIMILVLLITGCTSQAFNIGMAKDKENNVVDTGFSVSTVGSYDSADTAVVMAVDQENHCVIFMNMDTGRQYTLYYDGTTYVTDKYDGPMTISQIRAGDVVDVNFLKGKRQIANLKVSPSAWVYEKIQNYDLGGINHTASIGSSTYALPEEAVILSEGRRVEVMDVVAQDLVTIRGIDHKIYSINVEKGHGYLRLRNEQALIGGWIEVGNTVIREITEDMLLVVPEGSYQVALSNEGVSSTKDIVIERDKETILDVGDIEIIKDKTGKILFSVTPGNAKVSIDGEVTDISSAVELPYGIHQIHLEADGYDSLTKYIQVGSEYARISFELEEKKEDTSTVSDNTLDLKEPEQTQTPPESVSENTITPTTGNKVYIDSPKGVEVYVDSNYVGIAPVSFKKNIGSHTVTLRKSGYKPKSYTIYLYNDGEDVTYSFTDLEKEDKTVSGNGSGSSSNSTETKEMSYTVEYYKDGMIVDADTVKITKSVVGQEANGIAVDRKDINTTDKYKEEGYVFEKTDPETIPETVKDGDVIKVYYIKAEEKKKELNYTVEYYKDGNLEEADFVVNSVSEQEPDIIAVDKNDINITDKYEGYVFEKTDPETIPDTVNSGDAIKVYYIKAEEKMKELSYTVRYYKDGDLEEADYVAKSVSEQESDIIKVDKDDINITDKYEGYAFEKTDPETIPEEIENGGRIEVYYVKVPQSESGENDELETDEEQDE